MSRKLNKNLSEFQRDKFQEILDTLDTYRCGLELAGKTYEYEIYGDAPWNEIFYAGLSVYDSKTTGKTKNSGFMITFYQNYKPSVYCKINISIAGHLDEFNPRSIGAKLAKATKDWRKEKKGAFHTYGIPFTSSDELTKILQVFSKFLP